jgi:hypothetical protein
VSYFGARSPGLEFETGALLNLAEASLALAAPARRRKEWKDVMSSANHWTARSGGHSIGQFRVYSFGGLNCSTRGI